MTLKEIIEQVDEFKPNAFTNDTKTLWLNEIEGKVQTDVFLIAIDDVIQYDYDEDKNVKLLVDPPHDKIYRVYLTAMIDFYNGEYNKYQNSMQLFNAFWSEWVRWFTMNYAPAQKKGGPRWDTTRS